MKGLVIKTQGNQVTGEYYDGASNPTYTATRGLTPAASPSIKVGNMVDWDGGSPVVDATFFYLYNIKYFLSGMTYPTD